MGLNLDFPVWFSLASGLVALNLLMYLLGHEPVRGLQPLRILLAGLSWWSLIAAVELAILDVSWKIVLSSLSYLGIATVVPAWSIFSLSYRGKWDSTPRVYRVILALSSAFIVGAVFTNSWHHGIWTSISIDPEAVGNRLIYSHGPMLYGYMAVAYVFLLHGAVGLVRVAVSDKGLYRWQAVMLAGGAVFPLTGNTLYVAGLSPWPSVDLTPIFFVVTGIALTICVTRLKVLDLLPVAREQLFEHIQDGILLLDRYDRIVDMNRMARLWLCKGQMLEDWQGKTLAAHVPALWKVLAENGDLPLDLKPPDQRVSSGMFLLDGTCWMDVRYSGMWTKKGGREGTILTLRDVTDLVKAEQHLLEEKTMVEQAKLQAEGEREIAEQARQEADAANEAKRIFLTNMSHEMRTPLVAMAGFLPLLAETGLNSMQSRYVKELELATGTLRALVDEILDLSRIEAGRMQWEQVPVSFSQLAMESASLLSVRLCNRPVDLVVENRFQHSEGVGDPKRIRQMIMNLLENAIKFSETGEIRLILRPANQFEREYLSIPPENSLLAIDVRDTGLGVPEALHRALFEPFVQADASISRKYGGSGLGLAITRRLAEAMGGTITLESRVGEGSCFTLLLPVQGGCFSLCESADPTETHLVRQGRHMPNAARGNVEEMEQTDTVRKGVGRMRKAKVLVVDDTAATRRLLVILLERFGYQVHVAGNGQEALEGAREFKPDLILMDCQMPVMDGLDATRHIRNLEGENAHIPILAMTANDAEGERDACLEVGMDGFMVKPISAEKLKDELHRWIG